MGKTSIEWAEYTWNPLRARNRRTGKSGHYCEKISPGCSNCYASAFQPRFGMPEYVGAPQREQRLAELELYLDEGALAAPLRWRKPRRVFVCSMTDLFGRWVPDEWILACFDVMRQTPQHRYLVLTKRPSRMTDVCGRMRFDDCRSDRMWLSDTADGPGYRIMGGDGSVDMAWIWPGVSVESQVCADNRIQGPARWVSAEPLLGPVDLTPYLGRGVDWVVVGGESGPGARPCRLEWVRDMVRQCRDASVPCFVKQLGSNFHSDGEVWPEASEWKRFKNGRWNLKDSKGGLMEEWPADIRVRQYPEGLLC